MACPFCTMPGGEHDDECPYDHGLRAIWAAAVRKLKKVK